MPVMPKSVRLTVAVAWKPMSSAPRNGSAVTPPKVTSRVTGFVTPCSVRSPVIVPVLGPVRVTEVDLNVAVGNGARVEHARAHQFADQLVARHIDARHVDGDVDRALLRRPGVEVQRARQLVEAAVVVGDAQMRDREQHLGVARLQRIGARRRLLGIGRYAGERRPDERANSANSGNDCRMTPPIAGMGSLAQSRRQIPPRHDEIVAA